ncbi:MAG: hypothetical protein HOH65_13875 [Rhodospirillaceae bacterium]|nr:hypothetical protein [Rhodospirillaceae bacterium]
MAFGKKTFEILTLRDGAWGIEATAPSQERAQEEAQKLLSSPAVMGVRVAKETGKSVNNLQPSDILFEKLRPTGAKDRVVIHDVDEAPVCEEPDDLFGFSGRLTINRMFRAYLDKNDLTAVEVMHSMKEMKRLMDEGTLISSAIAKIATLQAKQVEGMSTNDRRDRLFDFINDINAKARAAQAMKLPRIRDLGYAESFAKISAMDAGRDPAYLLRVAMTTELVDIRNFYGKLVQSLEYAGDLNGSGTAEGFAPIDTFISDVLGNSETLQELMGQQDDLGGALVTLLGLSEGDMIIEDLPDNPTPEHPQYAVSELNRMIGAGQLPESQDILIDRVRRQLESSNPLVKGDRDAEKDMFRGLLDKLIPDADVVGGAAMAEAVTSRQSNIINKGGVLGMKEATASVLPSLRDPARKTGYLLALLDSKLGQDLLLDDIEEHLDTLLNSPRSVNQIVRDNIPPNLKMEKVTSIFYRIGESNLTDEQKEKLTHRLDDLLATYIVDGKILEKLDNPDRPLHIRAFMLVSMVQPKMLPRGKASELARNIIVDHLRRPNFENELVAEIADPSEKERVLREFHEQLALSGFFG